MKIIKIPAYSYFDATHSYRTDISILCDNALNARLNEKYGDVSDYKVWDESGAASGYPNFVDRVNKFFGTTILSRDVVLNMIWNESGYHPTVKNEEEAYYSGCDCRLIQVADSINIPHASYLYATRTIGLNASPINNLMVGVPLNHFYNLSDTPAYSLESLSGSQGHQSFQINISIFADNIFTETGLVPRSEYIEQPLSYKIRVLVNYAYDLSTLKITKIERYRIYLTQIGNLWSPLNLLFSNFNPDGAYITEKIFDDDDPYGEDGTSSEGGGDGTGGPGTIDNIDPAVIPPLPTINVCDLGLITMYNPSQSQVRELADFMWSGAFDINTYKKLFQDPMEGIIGLAIVPVSPSIGGSRNVKIGNIDSGVNMPYLASNWREIDCGWCSIEKYVGCFMDADPYTKISIYLPFIGIRQLSADDINGGSIHVVYHVDVLTGACSCFIQHSSRGVLYTYNGSCITNVPITAVNFSGAIQNAVSAVISGIGVAAGAATGAAPITAMGAMGLLNSAANTAINSKTHIQRSGNLGGGAGILSILNPYVIIERPSLSVPDKMQHFIGQQCNITYKLSQLSGFTMCEYVHIEDCTATADEISEIETLLKTGVFL